MVVLTIVTQQNGETIYFEKPIPRVHFMKLISCSLYNSWDNLKREGSATLGDKTKTKPLSVSKITPGHYNLERMAKEIDSLFEKYQYKVENSNKPTSWPACNQKFWVWAKPIEFDRDLANFLVLGESLSL